MSKIRVFTLNANGKIELTKQELEDLLDEAYRDGRRSATITTPSQPYTYEFTCDTDTTITSIF